METDFQEFKKEILTRAKKSDACKDEYKRAYQSETFAELMQVIKDNFNFASVKGVIDAQLIEWYKNQFNDNGIYCNVDVSEGFLLASDNATVAASGNATVAASGNATVRAWDNATVAAWGNTTVRAWDNATVAAWGNAYISSYLIIECNLSEHAIYRIQKSNTVLYASDEIKFVKVTSE
jgi:hypothetical protein